MFLDINPTSYKRSIKSHKSTRNVRFVCRQNSWALVNNGHISPIIALDELDKAMPHHSYGDSLAPLHTLLEPEFARSFADGCFPLPIDASHVIWIATANDVDRLATPMRSRFLIFNISNPTSEERLGITYSIASRPGDKYWGLQF